ncbi:MAG: carboxypeptidase regulatory-like domain-containing protein, partial [Planctomycetes bacterium]|nr:carboxypeptidase regulatory-like domain-containing protein [Planctomycetota bacterium]
AGEGAAHAPPTEGEAAAVDSDAVTVVGAALLDLEPLVGAALRFTSGARRVEVVTGRGGVFGAGLPPGEWTVDAPGLPDAEQVVCMVTVLDDLGALARAVADAIPRRPFRRARPRPTLRVVGDRDEVDPERPANFGPGRALLLRLEPPWVLDATVVDGATGVALPGATAREEFVSPDREPAAARAGPDGALRLVAPRVLAGVPPEVTFEAPGYAPAVATLGEPTRQRVGLRRPLRLEGRVRDAMGRPLRAIVRATVSPPELRSGATARASREVSSTCDGEGRFVLEGIPPGGAPGADELGAGPHAAAVDLEIACADHATVRLRGMVVVPGGDVLDVVLPRLGRLAGRVAGPDGRALEHATVRLEGAVDGRYSARDSDAGTGPDGAFALESVPTVPVLIEVSRAGFARARVAISPPAESLEIRLERLGPPIRGHVLDARGERVSGVWITAEKEVERAPAAAYDRTTVWHSTRTDHDGGFALDDLPAGHTFALRGSGRRHDEAVMNGVAGGATVTLRLPPEQDLVVQVEAPDGCPSARVTVLDGDGRLVIDDLAHRRGGFLLATTTLPATGRLALVVRAPGFTPALRWFDAPPGETVAMMVPLEPGGGAVALAVRWPQGAAPTLRVAYRDAALGLRLEQGFWPPSVADLPLRLEGVGAGSVRLEVKARFGERTWSLAPVDVVVRAGETTTVDLDLEAALRAAPPR